MAAGSAGLFTSSVIAEIVRGGLNSVALGQFEAGHSQGFHVFQVMYYIVLPQAYRNIVPTLLSQVVTTIKDSSYLANVAVIELMARVRQVMNASYQYNGLGTTNVSDVFVLFGLAAMIYFIINFTLSCIVRSMQQRRIKAVPAADRAAEAADSHIRGLMDTKISKGGPEGRNEGFIRNYHIAAVWKYGKTYCL